MLTRLDADESWSVSANEWGLFTRYFDAPDCVKTMVQWAEEKCSAASAQILKHPDSRPIKALLEEVFAELDPSNDTMDEGAVVPAVGESADTPRKAQRKSRSDEIEEVAEFLRMHLFVKVSHLRALTEEDWDKLSRQKIPYRVVKMLQSKVCEIDKCLKCIDYNVIISSSEIQKFCKSKEDMLPKSGLPASQSDQSSQAVLSKDGTLTSSASSKDQKVKIRNITFKENEKKEKQISFMDLSSKIRLKQNDIISIGTSKEQKDVQFQVVSVQGNEFRVKVELSAEPSSSTPRVLETTTSPKSVTKEPSGQVDLFDKSKPYPFDIVTQPKQNDRDSTKVISGALQKQQVGSAVDASGDTAKSQPEAMPSPRHAAVPENSRSSTKSAVQSPASSAAAHLLSSSSAVKQRKTSKTKVIVSFDDKMLNSTLRVAIQFLCDITCKSNKYLDYQRLFTTENTLKYLIQVVQILGQSEKLLHQEIAVLAVKYAPIASPL